MRKATYVRWRDSRFEAPYNPTEVERIEVTRSISLASITLVTSIRSSSVQRDLGAIGTSRGIQFEADSSLRPVLRSLLLVCKRISHASLLHKLRVKSDCTGLLRTIETDNIESRLTQASRLLE